MIYKNSQQQNPEPSSESQFQSLIETALDIVAILNHDGMIRYLSPSVLRITGYSPKELIGPNAFSFMHEEDGKQQFEVLKRWCQTLLVPLKALPIPSGSGTRKVIGWSLNRSAPSFQTGQNLPGYCSTPEM